MGNLMSLSFRFRMSLTKEEGKSVGRDEDWERGEERNILKNKMKSYGNRAIGSNMQIRILLEDVRAFFG